MPARRAEVQIQTLVRDSLAPFMLPPCHPDSTQTITSSVHSFLPACPCRNGRCPALTPWAFYPRLQGTFQLQGQICHDWRTRRLPEPKAGHWTRLLQLSLPSGHAPLTKESRDVPKSPFRFKEHFCKAQGGPWIPLRRTSAPGKRRQEKDLVTPSGFLAATGSSQEFDG